MTSAHVASKPHLLSLVWNVNMSKKKQQRNGFYYFMLDMQQDLRDHGRLVPMRDMPLIAGPKWSRLSDPQKLAYNQRAKQEKNPGRGYSPNSQLRPQMGKGVPRPGRMDSTGVLLSERRDHAAEMEERRLKERELLRNSLPHGRDVVLEKFYFMDFQSLCVIPKEQYKYLPCEVAVVEYTMHSGILRNFHKFVDPGPIPLGYRFLAMSTSENTHKIPVEGFNQAERDYRSLLGELECFLNQDKGREIPPVYVKRSCAERVEWCLQWLADKAGVENNLRVYEAEGLMYELSAHLNGKSDPIFLLEEHFQTSVYDYDMGIRCGFHEEEDSKYCSLAASKICAFIFSEVLCGKYGIGLTSKHLPRVPAKPACTVAVPRVRKPPIPLVNTDTSVGDDSLPDFTSLSVGGRGRGRGRGFSFDYGAVRQPEGMVGGLGTDYDQ